MEKIDLSTNSKKIQSVYSDVIGKNSDTTYGVFSVDKNGVLDSTASGLGDLEEFVEHFVDGKVQFGLAQVTVPGSDVIKNLLLGWCPDNAPAKLRLSFAANFADVSKVLSGYHVQITARDQDDLDVSEFVSRVAAAAGARYLAHATKASVAPTVAKKELPKAAPQKPIAPKAFIPKTTGKPVLPKTKPIVPKVASKSVPAVSSSSIVDEWGGESEIKERDFEKEPLESVPSAYKPTKVDINHLRLQKLDTISSTPRPSQVSAKGGESLVSRAAESLSASHISEDGRLTSLPKVKVSHSVADRYKAAADESLRPSFGSAPVPKSVAHEKLTGGISRNFGAQNGKTPAQLWAEKRGQYKEVKGDGEVARESDVSPGNAKPEAKFSSSASRFADVPVEPEEDVHEEEKPLLQEEEPEEEKPEEEEPEEEEPEEDEKEDAPTPVPAPILPRRNLPPPPAQQAANEESSPPPPAPPAREPAKAPEPVKEELPKSGPLATAQYDYEKDEDNEISFNEGDLIVEIEFTDEEWWSGKHSVTGAVGLFPATYVSLVEEEENKEETQEETPVAAAEPASEGKTAVAEYDYEKDEDNEIAFEEGDLIVEINMVEEDWWSGKNSKTGETGLFPANYVKLQ